MILYRQEFLGNKCISFQNIHILRAITLLDTLSVFILSERSLFMVNMSNLFAVQKTRQAATDRSQ